MLVHTALNSHKEPEKVLVISNSQSEVQEELAKHKFLKLDVQLSTTNILLETLQNGKDDFFDAIIIDEVISDNKVIFAHANRILKSDGLLTLKGDFSTLKTLASEFRIAMPFFVNSLEEKSETLLFGTKTYHPTADINLQRADFLDNCNYYNSDIHNSSFVVPNYIKNEIKDFVRN